MTAGSADIQSLADCRDPALAGGKAVNLGHLIRAGFPVPDGFVVTASCYAAAREKIATEASPQLSSESAAAVTSAYRAMGSPLVAVRSSATAEDLADASMAGQYETFLNIQGEEALLDAMQKCWQSVTSPRTSAYLREHDIDPATVAMAVVVQRLARANVAGVLFTANPAGPAANGSPATREMVLEASWGLGESVVSGRVQPDVFHLDFSTGQILSRRIADKRTILAAGAHEESPTEDSRRTAASLAEPQIKALWQLGRQVQDHFASPQDIEWAIENESLFLLQSRPITTLAAAHGYQSLLRETREKLQRELTSGRGPWVLHNLAETLPHPAPLTWSVIRRFMSGEGGFGKLYQTAGFAPSDLARREGFLELIAGRIYMDAARAPEMFSAGFPFTYDPAVLAHSPDPSQAPPTVPTGTFATRMKAGKLLAGASVRLHHLAASCETNLREKTFPEITHFVLDARRIDPASLDTAALISLWQEWEQKILAGFAADLLLPSLIAGMATADLAQFLAEHFFDQDCEALAQTISSGGPANSTVLADQELYEVGKGTRPPERWLADHGHRGPGEFDLASPRWREIPSTVQELAARMAAGESPRARHEITAARIAAEVQSLRGKLPTFARPEFDRLLATSRTYLPFREDAKNSLMLAYDLLRTLALEAGRRLNLTGDVFLLSREELFDALQIGQAPRCLLEIRRLTRTAESRLKLPRLITGAQIPTLGEPPKINSSAGVLAAFPVSSGLATGPARLISSPTDARVLSPGYILVCPSTDPSWTPLFINAGGLILERGGSLSHGAVVAREMGLPAVVLEGAMQLLSDGEQITVDGTAGAISRSNAAAAVARANAPAPPDPQDARIAQNQLPPPASRKDRRAAKIRNAFALLWTVYLALFFLMPAPFLHDRSMRLMDALLWPLVRLAGKPAAVAIVAAVIALLILLIQKFITDNPRLLLAKKRAAALLRQAAALPADSPRKKALLRAAAPVQMRSLLAALAPIAILLGPLVMPFLWFDARVDPGVWSPPPGSSVQVVVTMESSFDKPVSLSAPAALVIDQATPAAQSLPALRPTLEHLLALYQLPSGAAAPWEFSLPPAATHEYLASDLQSYLARGIPPQSLTWLLVPTSENLTGRFPVTISAGEASLTADVVLGEDVPPAPRLLQAPRHGPIKSVAIAYPGAKMPPPFWQPFHTGPLAGLHSGWVLLYILAYLPVLFLFRWLLGVA